MASDSGGRDQTVRFSVNLLAPVPHVCDNDLRIIHKKLTDNRTGLQHYLTENKRLAFVHLCGVHLKDSVISIEFEVSPKEVFALRKSLNRGVLDSAFKHYINRIEQPECMVTKDEVKFELRMRDELFYKLVEEFDKLEDNTVDSDGDDTYESEHKKGPDFSGADGISTRYEDYDKLSSNYPSTRDIQIESTVKSNNQNTNDADNHNTVLAVKQFWLKHDAQNNASHSKTDSVRKIYLQTSEVDSSTSVKGFAKGSYQAKPKQQNRTPPKFLPKPKITLQTGTEQEGVKSEHHYTAVQPHPTIARNEGIHNAIPDNVGKTNTRDVSETNNKQNIPIRKAIDNTLDKHSEDFCTEKGNQVFDLEEDDSVGAAVPSNCDHKYEKAETADRVGVSRNSVQKHRRETGDEQDAGILKDTSTQNYQPCDDSNKLPTALQCQECCPKDDSGTDCITGVKLDQTGDSALSEKDTTSLVRLEQGKSMAGAHFEHESSQGTREENKSQGGTDFPPITTMDDNSGDEQPSSSLKITHENKDINECTIEGPEGENKPTLPTSDQNTERHLNQRPTEKEYVAAATEDLSETYALPTNSDSMLSTSKDNEDTTSDVCRNKSQQVKPNATPPVQYSQVQTIDKTFMVYVPKKYTGDKKVSIRFTNIKCLETTELNELSNGLYSCTLSIPLVKYEIKYMYEMKINRKRLRYIPWNTSCYHESELICMDDTQVQRDCFEKCRTESIWAYLKYIIFNQSLPSESLENKVGNIEQFLKGQKIGSGDCAEIVLNITADLQESHINESILCVVAIGNIRQKLHTDQSLNVHQNKADIMVSLLRNFALSDLPTSCENYVPQTCRVLSEVALGCDYSMIKSMSRCYPFLNESYLIKWINKTIRWIDLERDIDICAAQSLTTDAIRAFKTTARSDDNVNNIRRLVTLLLTRCSIKPVIAICKCIHDNGTKMADITEMREVVPYLHSTLTWILNGQNVSLMIDLWSVLSSNRFPLHKHVNMFEKEKRIFEHLQQPRTMTRETVERLAAEKSLFDSIDSQTTFINLLATSTNPDLHASFLQVLEHWTYENSQVELRRSCVVNWFKKQIDVYIFTIKNEPIRYLYETLFKVLEIIPKSTDPTIFKELNELMIIYLKKMGVITLLQSLPQLESDCPSAYMSLCIEHLETVLKTDRQESQAILNTLKEGGEYVVINTRLAAVSVRFVLEANIKLENPDDTLESLIIMLSKPEIWLSVYNARGSHIHHVTECRTYRDCIAVIETTLRYLQDQTLSYCFFTEGKLGYPCKRQLLYMRGYKEAEINELLTKTQKEMIKKRNQIEVILRSLHVISKNIGEAVLPDTFDRYIEQLEHIFTKFDQTSLSKLKKCCEELFQNQNLNTLYKRSLVAKNSKVFWNIYNIKKGVSNITKSDVVATKVESQPCQVQCTRFVKGLLKIGMEFYSTFWNTLQTDKSIKLKYVHDVFSDCFQNISVEIECVGELLKQNVSKDCTETLKQLADIDRMIGNFESIENAVKAFGLNPEEDLKFIEALPSIQMFRNKDNDSFARREIAEHLKIVYDIAGEIDETTSEILSTIGNASSLIAFLKEVIDEDLRNLIDAVEDISEQHVSESTVSALIEVQRFVKPMFSCLEEKKCNFFVQSVSDQVRDFGKKTADLVCKIDECLTNLHNIKSLYNNFADREEQTKQVIYNIINHGEFRFLLKASQKMCDVSVSYEYTKTDKTVQTVIHRKSALCDYRSRALLFMNSDKAVYKISIADLETFVHGINKAFDVSELICALYLSGHLKYQEFDQKETVNDLNELQTSLEANLTSWNNQIQLTRETFYLMNFIQGAHIHVLRRFLEGKSDKKIVDTILKLIHPEMNAAKLKQVFEGNTEDVMNLGKALTLCYKHLYLKQNKRVLKTSDVSERSMVDMVENGKPFVARIDSAGIYVWNIVLALYMRTAGRLPEPSEVLLCSRETTWSDVELLLGRCFGAQEFYGNQTLYCIANVENLPSEVYFKLAEVLNNIKKGTNFLLSIICQRTTMHPLIDDFYGSEKKNIRQLSDVTIRKVFSEVCPNVRTFTSDCAGLGKSSVISSTAKKDGQSVKTFHVSGPFQKRKLIDRLQSLDLQANNYLHIDIGSVNNPMELDMFLFEIIILKYAITDGVVFDLPTEYVYIEVANTINNSLRNSLQMTVLFKKEHKTWGKYNNFIVSKDVNSPIQVVCHYLYSLEKGVIDSTDLVFSGDTRVKALPKKRCRYLLRKYISLDETFITTNICLNVLADQLKKMSISGFFKTARIRDMMGNKCVLTIKSSMVNALLDVSRELASRSVYACRSTQQSVHSAGKTCGNKYAIEKDLAEAVTQQVSHIIRWDESNHLMYVFHNQTLQTISPMYRKIDDVPDHIKELFKSQMKRQLCDYKQFSQHELQDLLQKIVRESPAPLGTERLRELSENYALTPDNFLKMVLIILRIKARVPVLVMGETGCGKTSLIRYLAAICEVPFDVVSIHAGVEESEIIQRIVDNNKDALRNVHRERWVLLDEINTNHFIGLISDMICHHKCLGKPLAPNLVLMAACNPYKLRSSTAILTSGLKGKVKTDAISRLVYRVVPLPENLVYYVWDFGSITENDERLYIDRIVGTIFRKDENTKRLYIELLSVSQVFSRKNEKTVSLRDIQRCKILTQWILKHLLNKTPLEKIPAHYTTDNKNIPAIILALSHCYLSRFSDRTDRQHYIQKLEEVFSNYSHKKYSSKFIQKIIYDEQIDILLRMNLPPGTAMNNSLRENVFVILICILNRIPIFLVGKPGCSKSLSMQVIKGSLRGKDSMDDFFKTLPQLYCVSFQGSESSTSDGIIKVFERAEKYQKANSTDDVLSVVILDEIGLAEISRFNPLKVLHNLLEPDGKCRPNIAVVGISNWSLDASKMNRTIHLSRPEMNIDELIETGISISHRSQKEEQIRQLARSYVDYINALRFEDFHGLRDYYSLVKHIAKELSGSTITPAEKDMSGVVLRGVQRNFGGLPSERATVMEMFHLTDTRVSPVLDLVKENVTDPLARHLMIITTGESVLGIIERSLNDAGRDKREILFGSQFEEDLTDDYNYRMLSRIILCMEQGIILILKDLETIYGSLYDMLNKNYTEINKKKHCRVALGAYSNPLCHVHDNFRCIVIIDETRVDYTDPPFFNRFEKQNVRFSDIINKDQQDIIDAVENWILNITQVKERTFSARDCFPMYGKDMVVSYVLQQRKQHIPTEDICKDLLWIIKPENVIRMNCCLDESIRNKAKGFKEIFFKLPLHKGIWKFLEDQINQTERKRNAMTIIFTNSSIHSKCLYDKNERMVQIDKLGAFKSEKQLVYRMQRFWLESDKDILFVQCSAIDDEVHIMLAKSIIEKYRLDFLSSKPKLEKHVYLIIHLDKSKGKSRVISQLNFLCSWKLVMLDSLESPQTPLPELCRMSLDEAIMSITNMGDYIKGKLFWAFTRIKYTSKGRDVDSIINVLDKLKRSSQFITLVEKRVYSWIIDFHSFEQKSDWQEHIACDQYALNTSLTLVDAFERKIFQEFDKPLAKFIFQMEKMGIIDSFLVDDEISVERRKVWNKMFSNEEIISISNVHDEIGPETYECQTQDLVLRMPFSLFIFQRIETTREEYQNCVNRLQSRCGLNESGILPEEVMEKLLLQQYQLIVQTIPNTEKFVYDSWMDDYIEDFCNLVSVHLCTTLKKNERCEVMKLMIRQTVTLDKEDPYKLFTALHTIFWDNAKLFEAIIQILEICQSGTILGDMNDWLKPLFPLNRPKPASCIESVQIHNVSTATEKLTYSETLVHKICEEMFPTPHVVKMYGCLSEWQQKVTVLLRLAANVSEEPSSLQKLRLCNDITTEIVLPSGAGEDQVMEIANMFKEKERIDSPTVFKVVLSYCQNIGGAACQRMLSQYLLRCVGFDTEAKTMQFLFKAIVDDIFPDITLSYIKLPLSRMLKSETKETYIRLLNDDALTQTDNLICLNHCLCVLYKTDRATPLARMTVDIIEEIFIECYREDSENNDLTLLFCSHKGLSKTFGLAFLVSVAHCKAFLSCIMLNDNFSITDVLYSLLTVIKFVRGDETAQLSFSRYFLKCLGVRLPLAKWWFRVQDLQNRYDAFEKLDWSVRNIELSTEMSPLNVIACDSIKSFVDILNETESSIVFENKIEKWIKNSEEIGMLGLYGAILQNFFLPRIWKTTDDTKVGLALVILNVAEKLKHEDILFLERLLGQKEFYVEYFIINQQTCSTHFFLLNVLSSLYSLLYASVVSMSSKDMSILAKCLLNPEDVKQSYLPGIPGDEMKTTIFDNLYDVLSKPVVCSCACGVRICMMKANTYTCSNCKNALDVNVDSIDMSFEKVTTGASVRGLSPIVYHILSIFTKGCLLGSVAIGNASMDKLPNITVNEISIDILWKDLVTHWEKTFLILNVDEYLLSVIFQAILQETRDLVCRNISKLINERERNTWEEAFMLRVENVITNRFQRVEEIYKEHNDSSTLTTEVEGFVREFYGSGVRTEEKTTAHQNLFMINRQPSMHNFLFEFEQHKKDFPFLQLVLKTDRDLSMPKHIIPIVHWHMFVATHVSNRKKRNDCSKMTVTDFLQEFDKGEKETGRKRFDAFIVAWDETEKHMSTKENADRFHDGSKLADFLFLEEGSLIFERLQQLVRIQNQFLDKALATSHTCKSTQFLCKTPEQSFLYRVDAVHVTTKQLVHLKRSLQDLLSDYSQTHNRITVYDFYSVEKFFAVNLLNGKAYINLGNELHRIVFADEMYKQFAALVTEIRKCIEQKSLTSDIIRAVHEKHKADPRIATELLTNLDVLMVLMKNTQGKPDVSLLDYADYWKTLLTKPLPPNYLPSPVECIKLCHVVALHELLEELCATSILKAFDNDWRQRSSVRYESKSQ